MIKIAYVLYTNGKNEWKEIKNNRMWIVIAKYNPKTTSMFLGQRFDEIYCDVEFTKSTLGRDIIQECIRPCAALNQGNFYFI